MLKNHFSNRGRGGNGATAEQLAVEGDSGFARGLATLQKRPRQSSERSQQRCCCCHHPLCRAPGLCTGQAATYTLHIHFRVNFRDGRFNFRVKSYIVFHSLP